MRVLLICLAHAEKYHLAEKHSLYRQILNLPWTQARADTISEKMSLIEDRACPHEIECEKLSTCAMHICTSSITFKCNQVIWFNLVSRILKFL